MLGWVKNRLRNPHAETATRAPPATPKKSRAAPSAPFEFVTVYGAAAAKKLDELRHDGAGTTPVVLGERSEFDSVIELMSLNQGTYEEYLQYGAELDIDAWIQQKLEENPNYYETEGKDSDHVARAAPLMITRDPLTDAPRAQVFIGLIPVPEPWQVPAYLRPGGWNDCPEPEVHVAFFKRWFEQYGAVVTCISGDTIEFSITNAPSTMSQALQLAREQFVYCTDVVHQGLGTLNNLATHLIGAGCWFFWWN